MTETLEIVTFRLRPGSEAGFVNETDRRDRQDSVAHVSFSFALAICFDHATTKLPGADKKAGRCLTASPASPVRRGSSRKNLP
ncbi:hypothetical protein RFM98_19595 [Mesorhizobium sp. VK9D]|uniref:hypothetical protein n=1 Tax=Mesorhizobium australafricanum TaxID=3072311 RepID=UPI002A243F6C|nr:hypothetical protein [Mesorhizobium sp. VK9D]MDX8454961.1 hypothetical protein [Mesorhizobium sp. VK9D]